MADEPESGEREEDAEIEIDVGSYEIKESKKKSKRKKKSPWSFEEVQIFQKGLELFGHKWTKIADLLETRTALQVKSYANKYLKNKAQEDSDSLIMISAISSSVHLKMEETNDDLDVEDVSLVNRPRSLAQDTSTTDRLKDCDAVSTIGEKSIEKNLNHELPCISEEKEETSRRSMKKIDHCNALNNQIDGCLLVAKDLENANNIETSETKEAGKELCSLSASNDVSENITEDGLDHCVMPTNLHDTDCIFNENKASEIIPEDEATEICHALLENPSLATKNIIKHDKRFCISIKLENLRQKDYLTKSSLKFNDQNKVYSEHPSKEECINKVNVSAADGETRRDESTKNHIQKKNSKSEQAKTNCLLLRRTTRHSKPITQLPQRLEISINLDSLRPIDVDKSLRPACVLTTQTLSEGWMMQKDSTDNIKKQLYVDDINVDRSAFGVIKHKIIDKIGQVSEKIEILACTNGSGPGINDNALINETSDKKEVCIQEVSSTCRIDESMADSCNGKDNPNPVPMTSEKAESVEKSPCYNCSITLSSNENKEEQLRQHSEPEKQPDSLNIDNEEKEQDLTTVHSPSIVIDKSSNTDTTNKLCCRETLESESAYEATDSEIPSKLDNDSSHLCKDSDFSHHSVPAIKASDPTGTVNIVDSQVQSFSSHDMDNENLSLTASCDDKGTDAEFNTEEKPVNGENVLSAIDSNDPPHKTCKRFEDRSKKSTENMQTADNEMLDQHISTFDNNDVYAKSESVSEHQLDAVDFLSENDVKYSKNYLHEKAFDSPSNQTRTDFKTTVSESLDIMNSNNVLSSSDQLEKEGMCTSFIQNECQDKDFGLDFSPACISKEGLYLDSHFKFDDCKSSAPSFQNSVINESACDFICPQENLEKEIENSKRHGHDEWQTFDNNETEDYEKLFLQHSDVPKLENDPFLCTSEQNVVESSDVRLQSFGCKLSERSYSRTSSPINEDDPAYDLQSSQFECAVQLTGIQLSQLVSPKAGSECESSDSSTDEDDIGSCHNSVSSDSDSESSCSSSRSSCSDMDSFQDHYSQTSDSDSELDESGTGTSDLDVEVNQLYLGTGKESSSPGKVTELNFSENSIAPIERKECREFFMGKPSKTPAKYIDIRNFIVSEWRKIKPLYLTKNSIRSKVQPDDANSAGRVHVFLENYGAINVGCSSRNKWVERMEKRREKFHSNKRSDFNLKRTPEKKWQIERVETSVSFVQPLAEVELDYDEITDEEKLAHPQYFTGNKHKSPDKYLKIRNSIIDCWKDSKPAYLTKQAARMAMSWYCGNVNEVSRVHDYLEQIGAINFGCAQEPRRGRPSRARMNQGCSSSKIIEKHRNRGAKKVLKIKAAFDEIDRPEIQKQDRNRKIDESKCTYGVSVSADQESCSKQQDSNDWPKNQFEHGRYFMNEQEAGLASDKSSVGDSGFDSISDVSPFVDTEFGIASCKVPMIKDDLSQKIVEDCTNNSHPTKERILDLSVITEEEKIGCPEFFVGSRVKPPEKYVKIRSSIIKSWQNRKPYYLNKHNARCEMPWYSGDINSIGRVHAFLESINVINVGAIRKPKAKGRTALTRKRVINNSPKYNTSSPETEDSYEISDKILEEDLLNSNEMTQFEKDAFKMYFVDHENLTTSTYIKIRNEILEMWSKCKPKYLCKSEVYERFIDDYDSLNFVAEVHSFLETSGLINSGCAEKQNFKNGLWDATRRFSLGLRPRKRWKGDINQDWLDKTASEGFTIKHLSPDEERQESRTRQLVCANKIRKSLPESDPYKLVPCRTFPNDSSTPFTVTICLKALLVMDFHSYLSSSEVIGLVGGKYYHASRRLEIMRVAPCSNVGTNLQCEMDPVSQAKASSDLAQHGLEVVGWYHSHPTFAPTPSLRDIDTQSTFQEWFSRAGAPFVGIIISPYNMSLVETAHKSQITCLTISDQWDESKSYRIPYMFKFKTEDLEKSDSFDDTIEQLRSTMQTVEGCKRYLCEGKLGASSPGSLLSKSLEAKLNRKIAKKDEFLSQVRDLIGI